MINYSPLINGEKIIISKCNIRIIHFSLFIIMILQGCCIAYMIILTNIKVKQGYEWIFRQFAERVTLLGYDLPKTLITNADPELMEAATSVFTTSGHLINQNYVLQAIRDVLFPFKKRIDFDFNMVNAKVEEAIVECDQINF